MKKDILVVFGGVSPEHEVSIITGLQVLEALDNNKYRGHALYITQAGNFKLLRKISQRKQFHNHKRYDCVFGHSQQGGFIRTKGIIPHTVHPYCAYLALHGGNGEGGAIQGLFDSIDCAYTSPTYESSAIVMNKVLTKQILSQSNIPTVESLSFMSYEITHDLHKCADSIEEKLKLPVIIKPAHLGSSIGISIARTRIELEKYLHGATFIDSEVLIERYLSPIVEYNCAVRLKNGSIETSEIERPFSHDEILSFAEKYEKGGKKTHQREGMSSLQRELPAQIDASLTSKIIDYAQKAYHACRCSGMVRIDFIFSDNHLYLSEINAIPGSMAFYLWEAQGVQFRDQITDLIETSVENHTQKAKLRLEYESTIVDAFLQNTQ